ncbi:MAG: HPr family phosphocarrier protein [Candidatus Onthomonas sp.]
MRYFQIQFDSGTSVKHFVETATRFTCDIDVKSGRYVIDGKSILGLFSIDSSLPATICFHGSDDDAERFRDLIAKKLKIWELGCSEVTAPLMH